ncbi:MAG: hypothetical protein IJI14_08705 [Anaerolineaceae bacterium]|nr:hypothetical protein [Anaerolineaceae bacterium]
MFILPSLFGITEASSLPAALILFFAVSAFFFPRFFRKKNADRNNRRFSHLLVLLLLIMTAAFRISSVQADNIILGSGAIIENNKVYFGTYNNSPVLWRVMRRGNAGSGMLLLSDIILDSIQFNPNINLNPDNNSGNVWYDSETNTSSQARNWCGDFFTNHFTEVEKSAVIETSKTDAAYNGKNVVFGTSSLNKEHVFFLSAEEAEKFYFPLNDDSSRKTTDEDTWWWLRSPHAYDSIAAGDVKPDDGKVGIRNVDNDDGARPAFNLNLTSVLFSSEISSESSKSYKLTLVDTGQTVSVTSGKTLTRNSLTSVTVPYTIDTGSNHVSLLITNNNDTWTAGTGWSSGAAAQYYETAAVTDSTGTVTFTLPDKYEDNRVVQKVWLLAEDVNDGNQSNYAGAPVEVTIPYLLQFAPGEGGSGTMDSKSVSEGDSFRFPACTFTPPAGKIFDHWKISGVDGLFYEGSVISIVPNCVENGVITVTAYWNDAPRLRLPKLQRPKTRPISIQHRN